MKTKMITRSVTALAVLAVAGCATDQSTGDRGQDAKSGKNATAYPFTMKNCGTDVTYKAAPKKIVTLDQTAAEILIHLGVGERIVGSGYEVAKTPDAIAEQYEKIPILSAPGQEIKHEKLLEAQPDFVYGSFASMFTKEQSGDRKELHELGVPTYLSEFDCNYHESVAGADYDMLFEEFRRLGKIVGEPEAGEKLATEQRAMVDKALDNVKKRDKPLKVMWFYSTYEGTPWAAGPGGLPQHISELVGVENIFADAKTKWAEVSWDEAAARNPDVIILADLTRGEPNDTAAEKIELLTKDPLTSKLDAVKNKRFITLPGPHMDPSYGAASAVPELVDGLNKLG
ncbi:ABC transporter substrate-binding protein [Streptomyces sp. DSM 3412]|uniref:ABC transporter substrate-binding protein n=1 Tax=Streptomyces gottesmaniae TaxID=3075518 RepID=A0ABU2Z633_9ACTN|nr:ABC transporter substrate-binding protein [Streptomyces sp. DSM 3412]MDT0571744.1 ABC transporter substrate-binding protein [Streptomyces sp. DSM 3412]